MARRKPNPRRRKRQTQSGKEPSLGISTRRAADGMGWILVHPRCARERAEDIAEVELMIAAKEYDIAIDELRWLLSGCSEFLEAHKLLGELAVVADNDVSLARGHFGFAYQLGLTALRRAGMPAPLLYRQLANRSFFESGRGLAWCLWELQKPHLAAEVVNTLLSLDETDPLQLRPMLAAGRAGGLPIVDLLDEFPTRMNAHDRRSSRET